MQVMQGCKLGTVLGLHRGGRASGDGSWLASMGLFAFGRKSGTVLGLHLWGYLRF